jgi:hypothetical protein
VIQQIVFNGAELMGILSNHVANSLPPETDALLDIQFIGSSGESLSYPPTSSRRKRTDVLRRYYEQREKKHDGSLQPLKEVGAVVVVKPKPKKAEP